MKLKGCVLLNIIFPVKLLSKNIIPPIKEIIAKETITFFVFNQGKFFFICFLYLILHMFCYIINIAQSNPIKTIEAKKLQSIKLPKKILFPSKSEIGSILKKA